MVDRLIHIYLAVSGPISSVFLHVLCISSRIHDQLPFKCMQFLLKIWSLICNSNAIKHVVYLGSVSALEIEPLPESGQHIAPSPNRQFPPHRYLPIVCFPFPRPPSSSSSSPFSLCLHSSSTNSLRVYCASKITLVSFIIRALSLHCLSR